MHRGGLRSNGALDPNNLFLFRKSNAIYIYCKATYATLENARWPHGERQQKDHVPLLSGLIRTVTDVCNLSPGHN